MNKNRNRNQISAAGGAPAPTSSLLPWIVSFSLIGACIASDFILWGDDRYQVFSNKLTGVRLLFPGATQLFLTFTLWFLDVFLLHLVTDFLPPSRRRAAVFGLAFWLAWVTWLAPVLCGTWDDLSQPLLLLFSVFCSLCFTLLCDRPVAFFRAPIATALLLLFLLGLTDCVWGDGSVVRWRGPWINANTYGAASFIGLWWCLYIRNRGDIGTGSAAAMYIPIHWLETVSAVLSLIGVVQSRSRTALWTTLAMLVFLWLSEKSHLRRKLLVLGLVVLSFLAFKYAGGPANPAPGVAYSRLTTLPGSADRSVMNRLDCWLATLQIGMTSPFTGVGWKYMDLLDSSYRPEGINDIRSGWLNNFTQMFATRGLIGLAGLFGLIIFTLRPFAKKCDSGNVKSRNLFLLLGLAFYMQMFFNDILFSPFLSMLFWLYILACVRQGAPADSYSQEKSNLLGLSR